MQKNDWFHSALVVAHVTINRLRALDRGALSKILQQFPISHPHVDAPLCDRYATGNENGDRVLLVLAQSSSNLGELKTTRKLNSTLAIR